jgi:hypothetical protein
MPKLTKKDLQKLGIEKASVNPRSTRYFVPYIGEMSIITPIEGEDLLHLLSKVWYERGVLFGETKKAIEIKRALMIDDGVEQIP